ncbi:MAG TPA: hypothetical protein VF439_00145 [Candidatus Paceibacterota bacterium]
MNIDDLSNSQLLLLTLLVNFVMAIATGIVTVSLLDKAPPTVLQSVNRIVEHTVETVAPAIDIPTQTVTQPQDSQPSEEDQLVAAISAEKARTVTIADDDGKPLALGVYLPKARAVVTASAERLPAQATAAFSDGTSVPVSISKQDSALVVYGFADDAVLPSAVSPALLAPNGLKQGQAVIALTADGSAVTGIISKVSADGITTTLPDVPAGSAAVSLSGGLVGIRSGSADGMFIGADSIAALLSATSTASGS